MAWTYDAEWSRVFGFGLLGFTLLLGAILALRNRRQAARLFLFTAPVVATCLAWWQRSRSYDPAFSFHRFALVFAGTALLLVAPGLFWLVTGHRGWAPLLSKRAGLPARQPILLNASLFLFLVLCCMFIALGFPLYELDCGGRPPVSVQTSPLQAVFTARVLFFGHAIIGDPVGGGLAPWAVMRVERRYWGVSRWNPGIVIVRGYFRREDAGQEYFVDGLRSQGALTRFLPVVEHYPCCHTARLRDAGVDLRVLRDGPSKSGGRIVGRVYRFSTDGEKWVPAVRVEVIGPTGDVSTTTDQDGIYDLKDLLPGHYSVRVGSGERWELDLKQGDVRGGDIYLPQPHD